MSPIAIDSRISRLQIDWFLTQGDHNFLRGGRRPTITLTRSGLTEQGIKPAIFKIEDLEGGDGKALDGAGEFGVLSVGVTETDFHVGLGVARLDEAGDSAFPNLYFQDGAAGFLPSGM